MHLGVHSYCCEELRMFVIGFSHRPKKMPKNIDGVFSDPAHTIWCVAETFLLLENPGCSWYQHVVGLFFLLQLLLKVGEHRIWLGPTIKSTGDFWVTVMLERSQVGYRKWTMAEISTAEPPVLEMESIGKYMLSTLRVNLTRLYLLGGILFWSWQRSPRYAKY